MRLLIMFFIVFCFLGCSKKLIKTDVIPGKIDTREIYDSNRVVFDFKEEPKETKEIVGPYKFSDCVIHFNFDSEEILPDVIPCLNSAAEYLSHNSGFSIVLKGFCDERGTVQYNFGLGQRRAVAVMKWLKNDGVKNKIRCESYGKSRLVRVGCTEDICHVENRRVEISVE